MNIAVIGGGINGIMTAWELQKLGHNVIIFEKKRVMEQTSSSSSKLLHGGLRYLENLEFRLVKEALSERNWWLSEAAHLTRPLQFFIPIYENSRRPPILYKIGLWLYDLLSGNNLIGKSKSLSKSEILDLCPQLKSEKLLKGFSYYDGQMNDYDLGIWALKQALKSPNIVVHEYAEVIRVNQSGVLTLSNETRHNFDRIINVAGPWSEQLLKNSNIKSEYKLDLVRGSHIVIEQSIDRAYFLEVPNERRIFFVLPYESKMLLGTTEQRQTLLDDIKPSEQEIDYLINAYNHYFKTPITKKNVVHTFAGVRPLLKSAENPNKATREYAIQINDKLITVFGGKWTTARQLAVKISKHI